MNSLLYSSISFFIFQGIQQEGIEVWLAAAFQPFFSYI
jgi:hypothetical protein